MPPPSSTGLTNTRHSSISPSFIQAPASPAPPTAMSFPGCSLSLETSSPTPSLNSLVLPTTLSSVVENTTFGRAFQILGELECSVASELSSSVSQ